MRRPVLALATVCALWGTIPLLAGWTGLPPVVLVFGRVWLAAAGLGGWVALRAPAGPRLFSVRPARVVAVGCVLALHWTAMFAGYARAPDATVAFVIFCAPVLIALGAPLVLGEALGRPTVIALVLAVAGFVVLAGPDLEGPSGAGIAWAGLAGLTFAALVLAAKPLAQLYGGLRLTLMEMVVAGTALVPLAARAGWGPPRPSWGWLAVLGLVHTGVGVVVYLTVLARIPAAHVGIIGYLEPVGVVVVGALTGAEALRLTTIIGAMLIIGAGAVVIRSDRQPKEASHAVPR